MKREGKFTRTFFKFINDAKRGKRILYVAPKWVAMDMDSYMDLTKDKTKEKLKKPTFIDEAANMSDEQCKILAKRIKITNN